MATYIIGDIHGCFKTFLALLKTINFNHKNDKLYLVGDLVNTGPDSLAVLEWVYQNQDSCKMVLGNHELKLICSFFSGKLIDVDDTFEKILNHSNADNYINWLLNRPLRIIEDEFILVHAGVYPSWNLEQFEKKADIVENILKTNAKKFLKSFFYLPLEKSIQLKKQGATEEQMALFYFTFMRVVDLANTAIFKLKAGLDDIPKGLYPWFRAPKREKLNKQIFFGHWSDLGFFRNSEVTCLDSACVKGKKLTAYKLETKQVIQESFID